MPTVSIGPAVAAERLRLLATAGAMACAFLYLGAALHRVQIVDSARYADALEQHSMRRVRLPSTRGRILDRHGTPLADNRPSYCVALYVEELRQRGAWSNTIHAVDGLIDDLSVVLGIPRELDLREIATHIHRRRPLPLLAWRGLDARALARLAECPERFRGVDVYVLPERIYPLGDCASHVIGYVGKGQPESDSGDPEEDFDFYLPDLIGRHGIEQRFDDHLAGSPGGQLIRVDAVGYKHESRTGREPVAGRDVVLSLNVQWQRVAEQSLQGLRGAVVVMDCENGEVLVLASSPRHNLSDFVPTLPSSVWNRLQSDLAHPLVNRAAAGVYAPGSIFKPVVALAALDAGIVTPETPIHCPGYYELPNNRRLHCWHRAGHGSIALQKSLEQSCNVYFCQVGVQLGYEPRIREDCVFLGLGQRPGIEIAAGQAFLPSDAWKRLRWRDAWRSGDTANLSVGQGFISVTPLQMAVVAAAIANGGTVLRPTILRTPRADDSPVVHHMAWLPASLRAVRRGMYDAVEAPAGTGHKAKIEACALGGKTGTAEYYEAGERRKHAWMIAFAPFEEPRYAITVIVENSDSGGRAAAPIVHRVFSTVFDCNPDPTIIPESLDGEVGGDGQASPRTEEDPPAAQAFGAEGFEAQTSRKANGGAIV